MTSEGTSAGLARMTRSVHIGWWLQVIVHVVPQVIDYMGGMWDDTSILVPRHADFVLEAADTTLVGARNMRLGGSFKVHNPVLFANVIHERSPIPVLVRQNSVALIAWSWSTTKSTSYCDRIF
jgi:hypothetical protein